MSTTSLEHRFDAELRKLEQLTSESIARTAVYDLACYFVIDRLRFELAVLGREPESGRVLLDGFGFMLFQPSELETLDVLVPRRLEEGRELLYSFEVGISLSRLCVLDDLVQLEHARSSIVEQQCELFRSIRSSVECCEKVVERLKPVDPAMAGACGICVGVRLGDRCEIHCLSSSPDDVSWSDRNKRASFLFCPSGVYFLIIQKVATSMK